MHSLRTTRPEHRRGFTEADRRQVAHAARKNETAVVRLMLESGLPVDGRGQHQATPLHWAAFHGNVEMARLLLAIGRRWKPGRRLQRHAAGLGDSRVAKRLEPRHRRLRGDGRGLDRGGAQLPALIGGSEAVREVLRRHGVAEAARVALWKR